MNKIFITKYSQNNKHKNTNNIPDASLTDLTNKNDNCYNYQKSQNLNN